VKEGQTIIFPKIIKVFDEPFIVPGSIDPWEDIPDTYDKPKLCRVDDPECEACQ